MVHRLYVEKRENHEAAALLSDIQTFLRIDRLQGLRILNRYDIENIDAQWLQRSIHTVFSEPPLDDVWDHLPECEGFIFAVEYLPGQYDQRADSAAQCIQLLSQGERPTIATAQVYMLSGNLTDADLQTIRSYVINPVERREAGLAKPDTLAIPYDIPNEVETLHGFLSMDAASLGTLLRELGLAMDLSDLLFCQRYFESEKRDPTMTEIRMIDTYWSDHCRHTTFLTEITQVEFDDPNAQAMFDEYMRMRDTLSVKKPVSLMNLATIGAAYLKHVNLLTDLYESEEVNACTVHIEVETDGKKEPWLLLFKNETHNHPTEIEPFGGAATCIGGAIRDPLSGRAYVYQAMRVTGAANPLRPIEETLPGKIPQKKLTQTAAAGYSAYGNQIGLATGLVNEIYHEGYAAKRMEIGAVIGAAPLAHVRQEAPLPGDIVVLLGGRTGRDGCGGATGSSKSHTASSQAECGAEVQKGNAPEERKLQRLFRNPEATRLIKRCNDFGAGGVSVAIGELADGLYIDLGKVPRKYEGLDGTALAISESQERMAVVLSQADEEAFLALAASENLEATTVAVVTEAPRLTMEWNGQRIVDISREFLNSNGAPKEATAYVPAPRDPLHQKPSSLREGLIALVSDLNHCARRGLCERFDATIGAGTVLMPFGGVRQLTPPQAMAAKLPVLSGDTTTCSVMSYGFDPYEMTLDPFMGAYHAVVSSVAKLIATGAPYRNAHLTFQEYFERQTGKSFGTPLAALLGALRAQLDLGLAAIGGKDSMSGTFEDMHVPPTLVSFAVSVAHVDTILSPEFKRAGARVALVKPGDSKEELLETFDTVSALIHEGKVTSAYTPGPGGIAEALFLMCLGNRIGFALDDQIDVSSLFETRYGMFLLETEEPIGVTIGYTTNDYVLRAGGERIDLSELETRWESILEPVFPTGTAPKSAPVETINAPVERKPAARRSAIAKPRVLIPVFPGTNCETDTARAFEKAGALPDIFVLNNLSAVSVAQSVERFAARMRDTQILFLPGGFSGGDEPDGSGKFITAFLRNPRIAEEIDLLLQARDGLIGGICNGFQALIKLGLLPYGHMVEPSVDAPTLTYNSIGRHQSRLVRTRVASNHSPWLCGAQIGDIHIAPISHGEGRFVCGNALFAKLAQNGQIATQYVDHEGLATMDLRFNPPGSAWAVEGITSPDGRIFGRMAHSERTGYGLYKNVPGHTAYSMFENSVKYFQ